MRKPDSCKGCPFYQDGDGFVPDELVEGAPVLVVGQNPGAEEEADGTPFVGPTGVQMSRHFFPPAGLVREEVSVANAYRCRWHNSNDLPPLESQVARQALTHCTRAHFRLPEGAKVIIAQGAYALFMLTGEGMGKGRTITSWRGYALPYSPVPRPAWSAPTAIWTPGPRDLPVLATLRLAALARDMSLWPALKHDWAKVPLLLNRKWPRALPPILAEANEWPTELAFDTEYNPETRELHRISVAGAIDGEVRVWVVEAEDVSSLPSFANVERCYQQNALADLRYWVQQGGRLEQVEDTMLIHSVLWSDLDHDLNFLGSLYGWTNRWKHLMYGNPQVYAGADAYNTLGVGRALHRQLGHDPQSEAIYRNSVRPLIPIIDRAERIGQRVDQRKARIIAAALKERSKEAKVRGEAAAGWPLNVGSPDQVRHELYDVYGGGRLGA